MVGQETRRVFIEPPGRNRPVPGLSWSTIHQPVKWSVFAELGSVKQSKRMLEIINKRFTAKFKRSLHFDFDMVLARTSRGRPRSSPRIFPGCTLNFYGGGPFLHSLHFNFPTQGMQLASFSDLRYGLLSYGLVPKVLWRLSWCKCSLWWILSRDFRRPW